MEHESLKIGKTFRDKLREKLPSSIASHGAIPLSNELFFLDSRYQRRTMSRTFTLKRIAQPIDLGVLKVVMPKKGARYAELFIACKLSDFRDAASNKTLTILKPRICSDTTYYNVACQLDLEGAVHAAKVVAKLILNGKL